MSEYGFHRDERLRSRKEIERLFGGSSASVAQYPLRLVWLEADTPRSAYPVQMAVSVSKKRFKRAVDRNRIKRLMREAYRLHKHRLYAALPEGAPQLAGMLLFVDKDIPEFPQMEKAMRKLVDKFIRQHGVKALGEQFTPL